MAKSPEAFRTISEVAELLETPAHVLRFWESRFTQIKPVKRAGGRRYYRPADVALLGGIRKLLHDDGITIRGVQKVLREQGIHHVSGLVKIALTAPDFDTTYDIEAVAEEPVAITTDDIGANDVPHEHPAEEPAADPPVAVTGFALESFVAKHGGKGLPLQGQDAAHARPVDMAEPDLSDVDHSHALSDETDADKDAIRGEQVAELPAAVAAVEIASQPQTADAAPQAGRDIEKPSPETATLFPSSTADAPRPQPTTRIPQRGQTPEDAIAMVDVASLPRMGASLRRTRPAALENTEPQLAAIYDRMRALRLRLAQDVGTSRR